MSDRECNLRQVVVVLFWFSQILIFVRASYHYDCPTPENELLGKPETYQYPHPTCVRIVNLPDTNGTQNLTNTAYTCNKLRNYELPPHFETEERTALFKWLLNKMSENEITFGSGCSDSRAAGAGARTNGLC